MVSQKVQTVIVLMDDTIILKNLGKAGETYLKLDKNSKELDILVYWSIDMLISLFMVNNSQTYGFVLLVTIFSKGILFAKSNTNL